MIRGERELTRFRIGLLSGLASLLLLITGCGTHPTALLAPRAQRTPGYGVGLDTPPGVMLRVKDGVSAADVAASYGGTVVDEVPALGVYRVALPAGDDDERCVQIMEGDTRVTGAEVNEIASIAETRQSSVAFSEGTGTWSDVHDQGALLRTGAPRAQTAANGSGVLVAILDTGISFVHPALANHLALPGIEPGVDIWPGAERAQQVDSNHDGIVDGALGHGTHVAGIVLAVAPRARLLPVRVLDSDGIGTAFDVANGIVQATDRGAQVINMSLGISGWSSAVEQAVQYARARGAVVVAPTGNDNLGVVEFPASIPEVIAVAGVDSLDQHASFTNYGYGTDLAAPATGILSTYFGGGYARWSGTSMAAPFVSGAAALLYGLMLPASPDALAQVENFLLAGVDPLTATDPTYAASLGAGRVDAAGSVNAYHRATSSVDGEYQRLK